jgi:hypothetical protein
MKLGKLKPVKPPSRLRRWFSAMSVKLAGRYVKDCHPSFMSYIEKNNILTASIWYDASSRRYRKIMRMLDSDKYRKYFYNAVDYKRGELKSLPVKWYVQIFDKIVYSLSKAYVFVFERELYKKIKTFETVSKGVVDLTKRMDEYIASTTSLQRLSRMEALGIISKESFKDDFDVIVNRVPLEVIEERYQNFPKNSENPGTFGSQWSMRREIPGDILKIIHEKK